MRIDAVRKWIEDHRDMTFDLVRIYLGIGLFVKGWEFIHDREFLTQLLRESSAIEFKFDFVNTFLAHYIPLAHLGGGLLLAVGLMTRISALFQLPILIGATFVVYIDDGLLTHNQEFQFTALVLFLLVLIVLRGAGRLSVDYHLKSR